MKITAFKTQLKNPGRVSVFVDGQYSFSLSLDELAEYKLKNDDEITAAGVKKFKKISADGKLKARSLAWLLNRPHSTREFHDYLRRKRAGSELAERLSQEFSTKKYLDDAAYGRWLVELRTRAGKSNHAISAELFKKGLSRELIEEMLTGEVANETDRLRSLIDKKRKIPRYAKDPRKLMQYLTSQGFSYSLIKQVLTENNQG